MSLPVRFPGGTGVTRDLSAGGMYFLSETSFVEGQQVSLTITLEHSTPDGPIDVTYRGCVVRTEGSEGGTAAQALMGVAVAGDTDGLGVTAITADDVGISPKQQGDARK
jgi:hypothetical protein